MSAGRVGRILAVNAGVLLAGVVVLELTFGSWLVDRRISNLNLVRDRVWVHDVSSLYDHGGEPAVYRRDEYALRGAYASPDAIDILTMGGSTTDQKYLSEGETWQDVLSARFESDGRDVSVVNAGVDGHSTLGHLRSFDWWFPAIPDLAPKYVLLFVGINDVHVDTQSEYDALEDIDEPTGWTATIAERSALASAFRTLRGIQLAERHGVGHRRIDFASIRWVDTPMRSGHGLRSVARRQAYASRLRALAGRVRALGAEPIFVTQLARSWKPGDDPDSGGVVGTAGDEDTNGVDMFLITSLFNQTTLKICAEQKAVCVDLASDLREAFDDDDFYDYIHTTPSGARKIGDYLYERLGDELRP